MTRRRKRMDPRPAFHYQAEADEDEQVSRGPKHLAPTTRWRSSVDVDENHRCSRRGSDGERDAEEHVRQNIHRRNREVQIRKRGSKYQEVNASRIMAWQVAGVRRPLVSASHIIQAGNSLFIGKKEAYIMNSKKEKSVLRKEGNVYGLDFFVVVPQGAAAPFRYKPMEVDAINQVQTEGSKGSELHRAAANQIFDRGRSERG